MPITRRQFVGGVGAGLVAAPLLSACESGTTAKSLGADEVLLGLYPRAMAASGEEAMKLALAKLDFSWLKKGDEVLIKIASNSPNPHPATTSPAAVRAMVKALKERGAARVVVGDQAGVEHVRLAVGDRRFKSTREVTGSNGLFAAINDAGGEAHFFDDNGYESGYFAATLPSGSKWTQPMMLPNIIKEVDHIVYLPRLSAHVLCGCTVGHKSAMGFLRDDSRFHVHNDGDIYEKYADINYAAEIASRLRLSVTLAEALLLDHGPDEGTVAQADPMIVIASQNLANHDAIATGLLVHFDATVMSSVTEVYDREKANMTNQAFVELGVGFYTRIPWAPSGAAPYTPYTAHAFEEGIASDRALVRAYAVRGAMPSSISVVNAGATASEAVKAKLVSHSRAVFT